VSRGAKSYRREEVMKRLIFILAVAAAWCSSALAQSSNEDLKRYVPILPSVKAQFFDVDPKL